MDQFLPLTWTKTTRSNGPLQLDKTQTGHDERVRARTIRTAQDAGRRGRAREPVGPAGPTATSHARVRRAILPMSVSAEAGRTCACWPAWRTGESPAIPPGGPGTSEKMIRRIMREDGLVAHVPGRRRYSSYEGEVTPAPDNLVNRDFTAPAPNVKWLTDTTRDQGP